MANDEEIVPEMDGRTEPDEEAEEKQTDSGPDNAEGKKERVRGFFAAFTGYAVRRPILFFGGALILGAAGAWGVLNGPTWKVAGSFKGSHPREAVAADGLRQQEPGRFYVPLREDGPQRVMVIDWLVVWDGLSAIRFSKSEVVIRNRIYDSLVALASREEGVSEQVSSLEETIGRALKEELRNKSVSVRIKEVKTY